MELSNKSAVNLTGAEWHRQVCVGAAAGFLAPVQRQAYGDILLGSGVNMP